MLSIELETRNIPDVFKQFKEVIEERYWVQRTTQTKNEIRLNPFFKELFKKEHATAFALTRCSELTDKYGVFPLHETQNRDLYPALAFAAQILSILDNSTPLQGKQLIRRIQGAIRKPNDMHALQLELQVATHFSHRGYAVRWPEMEGGGSTFDLLIDGIGTNGLEIECKSISSDKGRKIHRAEAIEFNHLLSRHLKSAVKSLTSGLCVVMTLPGRLPSNFSEREKLAKASVKAILSGKKFINQPEFEIRVTDVAFNTFCQIDEEGELQVQRDTVDQITETKNREVMIIGNANGGCVVCVLQSKGEDTMLKSVFDTLSLSAKKQLSGERAAILMAGFQDLKPSQLVNLAQTDSTPEQPATALRIAVSKYLSSDNRDHVVGVNFLSQSELEPDTNGVVGSGGSAYFFPKRESPFWHADFNGLFT